MSTKVASVSSSLPAYDSPAPLHRPRYSTPLRREFLLRMLRAASSFSRRAGFASRRLRSRGLHWRGLPWPPAPGSTLSRYLLELRRQTTHSTLRRESLGLSNVAPTDGAVLRSAPRSPVPTLMTGDHSVSSGSATAETVRSPPTSGARSKNPTLTLSRAEPTSPFRLAFAKRCQISRRFQPLPRHEPDLVPESRRTSARRSYLPRIVRLVRRKNRTEQNRTTPERTEVLRLGVSASCCDGQGPSRNASLRRFNPTTGRRWPTSNDFVLLVLSDTPSAR